MFRLRRSNDLMEIVFRPHVLIIITTTTQIGKLVLGVGRSNRKILRLYLHQFVSD